MDNILKYAANEYGFGKDTLSFISESTNKIYSFEKNHKPYILRITQKQPEALNSTKAEIEWLYFLAQNGVNVSLPLFTLHNELVTAITGTDGNNYILSAYEKANGVFWDKNNPALWNENVFIRWGETMGDIHRLTKEYKPSKQARRTEFTGDFALADSYKRNPEVKAAADEIVREIMMFPRDKESYGLIHNDFHPWNFLIDGNVIHVFDFDDCLYGWFALDIGIALYHGLWWGRPKEDTQAFAKRFIKAFLKGYLLKNQISTFWLKKIPLFMRYRQICKFSWFFDPDNVTKENLIDIDNIKQGVLFDDCNVEIDYFLIR